MEIEMKNTHGSWYDLYNGDCLSILNMADSPIKDKSVDIIITSPPYNTCRHKTLDQCKNKKEMYGCRYDLYIESMDNDEYANWTIALFDEFDRVLKEKSVVLYNYGMGSDSQTGTSINDWFFVISKLVSKTNFVCSDILFWKKYNACPNNMSSSRLTRVVEPVLVFCRKEDDGKCITNKKISSERKTGQKVYNSFDNFIVAPNNDGPNPLNKATYSIKFVSNLMDIYIPDDHDNGYVVMDPFNGTGTTGCACLERGLNYVGIELSEKQYKFTIDRFSEGVTKNLF